MAEAVYKVPYKTKFEIMEYARYVRRQLNIQDDYIDIVKVVEDLFPKFIKGYNFRIVNEEDKDVDMNGVLAYTESLNGRITMYVQEEVYDNALRDNGQARFTLAHEGGHVLMHCKEGMSLKRVITFSRNYTLLKNEQNSEWQADQFAAELLAPLQLTQGRSIYEIMNSFKVSYKCASIRKSTK